MRKWGEPTLANSITIENLQAGYGAVRVLHGISMRVDSREMVALLGTNGNGKSTILKCIMGAVTPTSGRVTIEVDGSQYDPSTMKTKDIVDLGVVLVPEGRRIFPKLTVEENLLLGAYRRTARRMIRQNLDYCYGAFPRLRERRWQFAGSLSGGEQQMLALARAIMTAPKILIVDEPSVGLAPIMVRNVIAKIGELKGERQLTVLMAEQNFNQAVTICERGYVIVHGQVAFVGDSPAELGNNELIRKIYLGAPVRKQR
jgi:branched-chain amino acid transport system ATP-binding protein